MLLDILHASNLEAKACYWKKGVSAMLCHPYCIVTYGQEIVRGKTVQNSRNPIIKDSIALHAPLSGRLGSMAHILKSTITKRLCKVNALGH